MVVIDKEKCTGCGSCVKVCHEHCMSLAEKKVVIEYASCSTCAQCIALCPDQALSWDGAPPLAYDLSALPSARQMDELFKERRTVREFTREPIARETLEEIVSYGVYAPTHNFSFRCIIVDSAAIIELFDNASFRFSLAMYRFLFSRPMQALVRLAPAPFREELIRAKPKLAMAKAWGRAFRSTPAALMCIVGDRRVPLSLESAQYTLCTMSFYAQAKGIGCRNLVGNQMAFNRSKAVRRRLNLGKQERIFAVMGLGHPAVTFRNKVQGRMMKMQWNEGTQPDAGLPGKAD